MIRFTGGLNCYMVCVYTKQKGDRMSKQTAVRLTDETFDRLKRLADTTGRTATFYIREAIEQHLEDLEDAYLAEQELVRLRQGKGRTWRLDEIEQELGLGN